MCVLNETIKKVKRQCAEWVTTFENHLSDKGLACTPSSKEVFRLSDEGSPTANGRGSERTVVHRSYAEGQDARGNRLALPSLARECTPEPTMRYMRMARIKKYTNVCEEVRKEAPSTLLVRY